MSDTRKEQTSHSGSHENLHGREAAAKIKELAEGARNCMFATNMTNFPCDCRPMALQTVDEEGTLWFISARDSEKNRDIENDPRVMMTFQDESKYAYLTVFGEASIYTDAATIEKFWTPFANAWFDGKDDPRVSIIGVRAIDGQYWHTQNGKLMAFLKMTVNAVTGSSSDDGGVEGRLKL